MSIDMSERTKPTPCKIDQPLSFEVEPYPAGTTPDLTRYEAKKNRRERYDKHPSKLTSCLGAIGIAGLASVAAAIDMVSGQISQGIAEGKEAVRNDHAVVHEIYNHPDDESVFRYHGTFVLTGFNTKDPSETAKLLDAHRSVGDVFALEYGNSGIDIEDIARRIVAEANDNGLKAISIDGYSAGGTIGLAVAAHIHRTEAGLHVTSVVLNSSPVGEDGLTPKSERGAWLMKKLISIYPDLMYYEDGRMAIEIFNRSDRYLTALPSGKRSLLPELRLPDSIYIDGTVYTINYSALRREIDDVRTKLADPKAPSSNLAIDQLEITTASIDEYIEILSQLGANGATDALPFVAYTRSYRAASDPVVNIDQSELNFEHSAKKYGLSYRVAREDVGHANPGERRNEYRRMIQRQLQPQTVSTLIRSAPALDPSLHALPQLNSPFLPPKPR